MTGGVYLFVADGWFLVSKAIQPRNERRIVCRFSLNLICTRSEDELMMFRSTPKTDSRLTGYSQFSYLVLDPGRSFACCGCISKIPGYNFVPEWSLLSVFAKLWKASVTFVMSVHLSVRMQQRGSHWTDFHEVYYYLSIFLKSAEKVHVSLKSDKNNRYFTWRPMHIFLSYLA